VTDHPTYQGDAEAELFGERLVTSVVVSALAGSVSWTWRTSAISVRRLVQQGGQDALGAALGQGICYFAGEGANPVIVRISNVDGRATENRGGPRLCGPAGCRPAHREHAAGIDPNPTRADQSFVGPSRRGLAGQRERPG
jgi:hypothetical protein